MPDDLTARMRAVIPPGQRNKVIAFLLENEIERREKVLYKCALEVKANEKLNREMSDWDVTAGDGIEIQLSALKK